MLIRRGIDRLGRCGPRIIEVIVKMQKTIVGVGGRIRLGELDGWRGVGWGPVGCEPRVIEVIVKMQKQ